MHQGVKASQGFYSCWLLEGEFHTPRHRWNLTAPLQVFLHRCRSGSHFRFPFPFGQAGRALALRVLAALIRALLLAFWLHPFGWDPGGAARTLTSLLYCSSSLLHCKVDMAHRFIRNPLGTFWNFPLCHLWSCHARDATKISPTTNISRPRDLMLCCIGLGEWVAKVASDALLAAVPSPW